jgi:hypothetical protein
MHNATEVDAQQSNSGRRRLTGDDTQVPPYDEPVSSA